MSCCRVSVSDKHGRRPRPELCSCCVTEIVMSCASLSHTIHGDTKWYMICLIRRVSSTPHGCECLLRVASS